MIRIRPGPMMPKIGSQHQSKNKLLPAKQDSAEQEEVKSPAILTKPNLTGSPQKSPTKDLTASGKKKSSKYAGV